MQIELRRFNLGLDNLTIIVPQSQIPSEVHAVTKPCPPFLCFGLLGSVLFFGFVFLLLADSKTIVFLPLHPPPKLSAANLTNCNAIKCKYTESVSCS